MRKIISIYLLVVLLSLSMAREYVDKKAEERQSWFVGSRYGRSGNNKHLMVTPRRDDRFYPGSRYGKRTSNLTSREPTPSEDFQCAYTGVADLYRCYVRKDTANGEVSEN